MPFQASRRHFLALAGASAGLVAANAQALERKGEAPPWEKPSGPFERLSLATVVGFSGAELEVEVEGSGLAERLAPRDFGDWVHQVGDRVVIVQDRSGHRAIRPYVITVDAPLPRRPPAVEIGSVIAVGQYSARVTSESVRATYEAIRAKSYRGSVHWLLIENVRTGEHRLFGIIDRE